MLRTESMQKVLRKRSESALKSGDGIHNELKRLEDAEADRREVEAVPSVTISTEARNAILQREIASYLRKGFRVVSQTHTTAQLIKPKKFSLVWAFLWLLVWIFGVLIYLIYFAAKRDQQVYLEIDERGFVVRHIS